MLIYKITNIKNGKIYIGKTTKSLDERFSRHCYSVKYGSSTHLHNSMRKHGRESFRMDLVEECIDDIDDRERFYIETLSPEYNMTIGGDGGDTSKSPNFIRAIEEHHSVRSEYPGRRMLGKNHSKETKIKQSKAIKSHWDSLSKEDRLSRSKSVSGEKNGMYGKTPKNSLQIKFDDVIYQSIAEASRATGHSAKYLKKHGKIYYEQV